MNEGWVTRTLGDLVERVTIKNEEGCDRVLSVSAEHGLVDQERFFTKRVASKNLSRYTVVRPGEYVYNKSYSKDAPLGVVARNLDGEPGVVSPLYIAFRLKTSDVVDGFLEYAVHSEVFAESLRGLLKEGGRAHGALNVKVSDFFSARVLLPPLVVQRWIVDLMEHLDNHVEALADEGAALSATESTLVETLIGRSAEGSLVPLGHVGHFVRGRRFTKQDYVASGLGCIHYGHLHTHLGPVTTSSLNYLPDPLRARLRLARPGDVVVAAASEDVAGLGRATVWLGDDDVAVHDDCYIFQHGLDPTFASYVFRSPWFQHQKQRFASGTKVTRISGADLAQIEVPVPLLEDQKRIGAVLQQSTDTALALREEAEALRAFRAAILGRLLSGHVAIPDTYDELIAVAS
jgi:restriction endonuclease S subunit